MRSTLDTSRAGDHRSGSTMKLVLAWGLVGIPLLWGVFETALNAAKLFQ